MTCLTGASYSAGTCADNMATLTGIEVKIVNYKVTLGGWIPFITPLSSSDGWLALTPEGYFAGSEPIAADGVWKAGGRPVADANVLGPLADAAQVAKAARGQKVAEPALGR